MASTSKIKLRTSEDVFNRLQWDAFEGKKDIVIGYEDRICGHLEKSLQSFVPISQGGDIPFHRLWYFRRGDEILWDRNTRTDFIFNSGESNADLSETRSIIRQARRNMALKEEKRKEMIERGQKAMQRRQRLQATQGKKNIKSDNLNVVKIHGEPRSIVGGMSEKVEDERMRSVSASKSLEDKGDDQRQIHTDECQIRLLTYNVLMFYGLDKRTSDILDFVDKSGAEIIALQEVTCELLCVFLAKNYHFAHTSCEPYGQALISKHPIVRADEFLMNKVKRCLFCEIELPPTRIAVAVIHLTSNRKGDELIDNRQKRVEQARNIVDEMKLWCSSDDDIPFVIAGDLNQSDAVSLFPNFIIPNSSITFCPEENCYAKLALDPNPYSLDHFMLKGIKQVVSCEVKKPKNQVGEDLSDHYPLIVDVIFGKQIGILQPSKEIALAWLLPESALKEWVEDVRRRHDTSFLRWPPHINVFFPFCNIPMIPVEATMVPPVEQMRLKLTYLNHGRDYSVVLVPHNTSVLTEIRDKINDCLGSEFEIVRRLQSDVHFNAAYVSHLTLGSKLSFSEATELVVKLREELIERGLLIEGSNSDEYVLSDGVVSLNRLHRRKRMANNELRFESENSEDEIYLRGGWIIHDEKKAVVFKRLQTVLGPEDDTCLFPAGSATLGMDGEDLDICAVSKWSLNEMGEKLRAKNISSSEFIVCDDALVPVLRFEIDGVVVEIQKGMNAFEENVQIRAKIMARYSISGISFSLFLSALSRLRLWAKSRHIVGKALGFMPGCAWHFLLSHVCSEHIKSDKSQSSSSSSSSITAEDVLELLFHFLKSPAFLKEEVGIAGPTIHKFFSFYAKENLTQYFTHQTKQFLEEEIKRCHIVVNVAKEWDQMIRIEAPRGWERHVISFLLECQRYATVRPLGMSSDWVEKDSQTKVNVKVFKFGWRGDDNAINKMLSISESWNGICGAKVSLISKIEESLSSRTGGNFEEQSPQKME